MRLLVDTHVFLWATQERSKLQGRIEEALTAEDAEVWLSVVSVWETRVKHEAGRLPLVGTVEQSLDRFLAGGARLLMVERVHALASLADPPPTNDPFDRLLLAQCEAEGMRLLTVDRKLRGHRLSALVA